MTIEKAKQYLVELKKHYDSYFKLRNDLFNLFAKKQINEEEFNILIKLIEPNLESNKDLIKLNDNELITYESFIDDYNTSDIYEFDYVNHANLNYTCINNGKYLSPKENPYEILVQAVADENGEFIVNEKTTLVTNHAFYGYYASKKDHYTFKKLTIPATYNGSINCISFVCTEELDLLGDNNSYYYKNLVYLYDIKCIYAPKIDIEKIKYKDVKNLLTAGYLKYKSNKNAYEDNIREKYEKYLKKGYKNFYQDLKNDILLDYLIDNKLINENDLYDLLSTQKDNKVLSKLKDYSKDFLIDIDKEETMALELFNEQKQNIENTELVLSSNNYSSKNRFKKIEVNTPYMRKVQTYWRGFIKEGDIFYTTIGDNYLFLEVVEESTALRFTYECRLLSDEEADKIINKSRLPYNSNSKEVLNINSKMPKLSKQDIIKKLEVLNGLNDMYNYDLNMDLGIFKHLIYDDKLIELPDINNKKEIYLDKQLLKLFEAYFKFGNDENPESLVYFRKLNPKHIYEQLNIIPNVLMSSALDLRTSLMNPYAYKKDVTGYYKNSSGKIYKILDIFKFINSQLTICKNDTNFRNIQVSFSDFYQQSDDKKFTGFSKNDILDFLNKYFVLDYALGFYYGWDSIDEIGNDILCYDKRWFKILYETARKYKNKKFNSCDEIDELINKYKVLEFNKYVIDNKYIPFFTELAKKVDTIEKYITVIKPYLLKIINNKW